MTKQIENDKKDIPCPCKQKKSDNSGWFEPEKNEEGKSKRHSEIAGRAAIKDKLRDTSRIPMRKAPEPENEP